MGEICLQGVLSGRLKVTLTPNHNLNCGFLAERPEGKLLPCAEQNDAAGAC